MTTRIYEFGSTAAGLHFKITATENLITHLTDFTVEVLSGSFDLNAVYWGDGDKTDDNIGGGTQADDLIGFSGKPSENSLNMNGDNIEYDSNGVATASKVVYDGGINLSDTGLGSAGTNKGTFLTTGETHTFSADIDFADFNTVGVRATSTSTAGGSIKWVDGHGYDVPPPPPPQHECPVLFVENFDDYTALVNHADQHWFETNLGTGPQSGPSAGHGWAITGTLTGAYGEIVDGKLPGSIASTTGDHWLDTQNSPGGINISNWFNDPTGGAFKFKFDIGIHDFGTGPFQETAHDAQLNVLVDGQIVKTLTYADVFAMGSTEQMHTVDFQVNIDNGDALGNHSITFQDVTPHNDQFVGFSLDSIEIKDVCSNTPHQGGFLFEENFDEQLTHIYQTNGVDASGNIDLVAQGWTGTGHTDQFGFQTWSEVGLKGVLGGIQSTSGSQWLDTQNTPGGIDISHTFVDPTAAVGGKTAVLSFDIAKMAVNWDGKNFATDPNAAFQFKLDGQVVAEVHASDLELATPNAMHHFNVDIAGYANPGTVHTLEMVDTTADHSGNTNYFGFAVDSVQIHDWVI
jgi:hypothetical protein